jgi:hypothetical protein
MQRTDTALLLAVAAGLVALHMLTNGAYGFHRDELATFTDAQSLAWGYVGVPPVTPFLARAAWSVFGASLIGLRAFAVLAMALAFVLTGLMTRALGGGRWGQLAAALAAAISPVALSAGTLYQYVSLDYLCWVMAAYGMARLFASDDPRWFAYVGAVVGLGMLTKYTMAFFAAGIVAGVVLTPARRWLRGPWPWIGVALAFIVFSPNLLWLVHHDFITLDFLASIHARDIRLGRTGAFFSGQFWVATSLFAVPLWIAGAYFLFFTDEGRRFRALGWMFVVALALVAVSRGRDYYLAPAYPMLFAAGAVWIEQRSRMSRGVVCVLLVMGGMTSAAPVLPVAPVGSSWWRLADHINGGNFNEQLGWPELAETLAHIRDTLPADERASAGIFTGDTAQAGAIDIYGAPFALPHAISGTNGHWFRGYGDPPPSPLIVVGVPREIVLRAFVACHDAGRIENRFGVDNTSIAGKEIFVCDAPREPWPQFWRHIRHYG